MAEKEILLTEAGLKKMEDELETLKTVKRKEVAERLRVAIDFGDLSENSEYDDAKNEQAFIEGTIKELEEKLRHVRIISENELAGDVVAIGNKVKMYNETLDRELEYTIVGSTEANPAAKKISNESPIGKGILGHKVGEVVEIQVPAGLHKIKIVSIG